MLSKNKGRDNVADLIVSVESRKGGVGKTTAALCLARTLLRRDYSVLVLDMDVTGTNAADIAKSPFWIDDIHIIGEGNEEKNINHPLNLITLFDKQFMTGQAAPAFSTTAKPRNVLIDLAKVNILGSQLYQIDGGRGTSCIECPAILFDDLHTLWLLEFLKQITGNFVRTARTGDSERIAVILDNSPGYVGIAPAIHEWLTDSGPELGKFLIVASLDEQDLLACQQATAGIHALYARKWKTSRLFLSAVTEEGEFNVGKDQELFFIRLASMEGDHSGSERTLKFYRTEANSSVRKQDEKGQRYCDHPIEYIAAVINRVPRAVKSGHLVYDFPRALSQSGGVLERLFVASDGEPAHRSYMISYDEYIENQFLLQSLERGRRKSERRIYRLRDALKMSEEELRFGLSDIGESNLDLLEEDIRNYRRLRELLANSNDIVSRARTAVEDAGLGHLARLIRNEWLPGSIIPRFRSAFSKFLRESDFPFFEMMPLEFEIGSDEHKMLESVERIKKNILMEFRHASILNIDEEDQISNSLARVLALLAVLSITPHLWHSPPEKEIPSLFAAVLAFELKHWSRRSEKSSIQGFLAKESVTQSEIRKDMEKMEGHFRFFNRHMWKEQRVFTEFYRACTQAQARLIDFIADARFLLQLLRFVVEGEIVKGALFPFVGGIAEDVISKKTVSHEEAPRKMAKAVRTTLYFREFDEVLIRVLAGWGIDK